MHLNIKFYACRNYSGQQRAIDLRGSSIKNVSRGAYSPPYEVDDDSHSK